MADALYGGGVGTQAGNSYAQYQGPTLPGQNANLFHQTGIDSTQGRVGYNASSPNLPVGTSFNPQTGATNRPAGSVLGASTSQSFSQGPGQGSSSSSSSNGIPSGNPYATYVNVAGRGSVKVSDLMNEGYYNQPTPQDNMPDYQSMIQPTIDALNGALGTAQSSFGSANSQIDANSQQARSDVMNQQQAAMNTASQQQQGLSADEQNQEALQRQGAADTARGIQAQFGGTSSAGQYLGEQAYRGSLQNIGQLHAGLQNAMQQINNQVSQVHNVTASTLQNIDQQTAAQKQSAQNQLDQAIQQVRMAQGQLQSQKAQMVAQHIQDYQSQVNAINSQNAQFKQNLALEAQRAQQMLAMYGHRVSQAQSSLESVVLGVNPMTGEKTMGTFNPSTGQYGISTPVGTGMTPSAGGGQLDFSTLTNPQQQQQQSATSPIAPPTGDTLQRLNGLFGS